MIDKEVIDASQNLNDMRERWEDTPEWHEPPLLDGEIHVSTRELRDVKILLDWIEANTSIKIDRSEYE